MRIHQGKQYLVIWSKINLGKDRNDFWFVRTGDLLASLYEIICLYKLIHLY